MGNGTPWVAAYNALTNQVSNGLVKGGYDANGNQLSSTSLSQITWTAGSLPASVKELQSGTTHTAVYDALGHAVESNATAKTLFLYGASGAKVAKLVGGTLTAAMVPLTGGETAVYNASGLQYMRHKDWLGSSRLATTWAHAVYSKESYAPFGETYNEANTPDRSFTGQEQDTVTGSGATGTYDFPARSYDPAAGRWLSPDPKGWGAVRVENPQTLDRYAYVVNDPMSLTDPTGMDCVYDNGKNGVSISPGDCPTDAHGQPTDNGVYIDCTGCVQSATFDAASGDLGSLTTANGTYYLSASALQQAYSALATQYNQQADKTAATFRSTMAWMVGGAIAGSTGGWLGSALGALGGLVGNVGESVSYRIQAIDATATSMFCCMGSSYIPGNVAP